MLPRELHRMEVAMLVLYRLETIDQTLLWQSTTIRKAGSHFWSSHTKAGWYQGNLFPISCELCRMEVAVLVLYCLGFSDQTLLWWSTTVRSTNKTRLSGCQQRWFYLQNVRLVVLYLSQYFIVCLGIARAGTLHVPARMQEGNETQQVFRSSNNSILMWVYIHCTYSGTSLNKLSELRTQ